MAAPARDQKNFRETVMIGYSNTASFYCHLSFAFNLPAWPDICTIGWFSI
jgi:hypothetical protein